MCGLFGGYSSVLIPTERDVIQTLMILNFTRGQDSTGIYDFIPDPKPLGKNHSHWWYWREAESPLDFARTTWNIADEKRWKKASPRVIAGHARAATKGKINKNNAHPFYHKPIIGMHNGTIWGPFDNWEKYDTDSEALIHNIAEMGVKDAVDNLRRAHSAAYALVWSNYEDCTLNFLRNDKRPLHFARQGKEGHTLFWSSEALQLELALSYLKEADQWEIMELPINKLYSFDLNKKILAEPEITDIAPPTIYSYSGTSGTIQQGQFGSFGFAEWQEYDNGKSANNNNDVYESSALAPWQPQEEDFDDTLPPRVVLGSEEGLTKEYLHQFSRSFKYSIFNNWDIVTQRWFPLWALRRTNEIRTKERIAREAASKNSAVEDNSSSGAIDTNLNDDVPDLGKVKAEEAKEVDSARFRWENAAPWYVNGEPVETYAEWLQATKNGCAWCRNPFVLSNDVIWISREYALCEDHAREALVKGSEIHNTKIFSNHSRVILNGLKKIKKRLMNETRLRSTAMNKIEN